MIEVTCGACGSTSRFPEADVPPGGKTVTCGKCKARLNLPARTAGAMPSIPSPAAAGGKGDVINLSDLPAPKRPSPLAGAAGTARPIGPPPIAPPQTRMPAKVPSIPSSIPRPAKPAPPATPIRTDAPTLDMDAVDLPAPVGPTSRNDEPDLPAPKRASAPGPGALPMDLLAPKRPSGALRDDIPLDLPTPKRASGRGGAHERDEISLDLPAPERASDGDEISLDLPTPKGPTSTGALDLPAPKGFFDDLPAPRDSIAAPAGSVDLPAPKGFFDDLPGPSATGPVTLDMPAVSTTARTRSFDLDDLDLAPPLHPPTSAPVAAPPPRAGVAAATPPLAMPLELEPNDDVPALELDGPPPASDRFGGLDLPAGPTPTGRPTPEPSSFRPSPHDPVMISSPRIDAGALDLDIDDSRKPRTPKRTSAEIARPTGKESKAVAKRRPLRTILLAVALVLVGAGAGGFYLYQRHTKEQATAERRAGFLADAQRLLAADSARHWAAAADAAENLLAEVPDHPEALAIAAQAYLAGYLDDGGDKKKRLGRAEKLIEKLRSIGATGPEIDKALALFAIVHRDTEGAVKKLSAVADRHPADVDAHLFLGWARGAAHDWKGAIAAYEKAADSRTRAVAATYGMGLAYLQIGDLEGARRSFSLVNEMTKKGDHIGAQIGIAAAMPASDYARRETELLAILGRKDIGKADARVVALGWSLAGDDARRAGRLDAARARYRRALELDDEFVDAIAGDGEIALAEGRLDAAGESLRRALEVDPNHVGANLALADLELRQEKSAEAGERIARVLATAVAPLDRGRAYMLEGKQREVAGNPDGALASYRAAQEAVGTADIAPTVAQAALLGRMAAAAQSAGQSDQAQQHRAAATQLLAALEEKARQDPATALTLGRAYLAAGEGARAEAWLVSAQAARPEDVEVLFQLAAALALQGKQDAAVERLRAAFELDPGRVDVGLELARTFESAGRRDDAAAMYGKLLASPQVTLDMRVRAGLFYARTGDPAAAAVQGAEIAKAEPNNPAGMYLRGAGLHAEGKHDDARKLLKGATAGDAQAIYFELLGRAAEAQGIATDETLYRDEALAAYGRAAELDPTMLPAQLGRARLHLQRNEWDRAIEAYDAARALDARQPDIALGLGLAYNAKGNRDKAVEWLSAAVKLTPTAKAHFELGKLFLDSNVKAAATHYAAATRLALDDERAGKGTVPWLTDAYWQLGQLQEPLSERAACDAYNKYLMRNPTDAVKVREVKSKRLALRC